MPDLNRPVFFAVSDMVRESKRATPFKPAGVALFCALTQTSMSINSTRAPRLGLRGILFQGRKTPFHCLVG